MAFEVGRVLADLRELAHRTGGPAGARRVCWTDEWVAARAFLRERLAELPVSVEEDAAGNLWAELPGAVDGAIAVGSHVDSVPAGGWLDGALGVFAALECLREQADADVRAVGLRLGIAELAGIFRVSPLLAQRGYRLPPRFRRPRLWGT